jgi:hypothetical protein
VIHNIVELVTYWPFDAVWAFLVLIVIIMVATDCERGS